MGYNLIMFLSGIQHNIIAIVVPIVVLQYAFALFCLLKLAYFELSRRQYIIWNVIILFAFFIGGAVFLVYYYKHPDKRVPKTPVLPEDTGVQPLPDKNGESPSRKNRLTHLFYTTRITIRKNATARSTEIKRTTGKTNNSTFIY